eukprot:3137512-Pleurochrysis_carterae.AAC.1
MSSTSIKYPLSAHCRIAHRILAAHGVLAAARLNACVTQAREPNLAHRRAVWQTRASMTGGGVARGFGTDEARATL